MEMVCIQSSQDGESAACVFGRLRGNDRCGGFALSILAWQLFRGSPFGRLLGILSAILFIFAGYHDVLLVLDVAAMPYLESAAFTGLLVWVILMIRQHHRQSCRPTASEPGVPD